MDARHPPAEVHIDEDLVRELLWEQHPDLATEKLALVDEGWDNVTYRVGEGLAARVPRREAAVRLLVHEQRWLPYVAPLLEVPVPVPVRVGVPGRIFPWPWSLVGWIPGVTVDKADLVADQAETLARVLGALHHPAPAEAPSNPLRGIPLRQRSDFVHSRIDGLRHLEPPAIEILRRFWEDGVAAPEAPERVWLHGDLHPRNVLVSEGALAGIIDWGDMAAGDRATDLAAAWMLLGSAEDRHRFWREYGPQDADVVRARAWAVFFGAGMADSGEARHEVIGRGILERVLAHD